MPFVVFMALTGLVILYTQPLQDLVQGEKRTVDPAANSVAFDEQAQAVALAFPDYPLLSLTTPTDSGHAVVFGVDDGSSTGRQVFVNPYTGDVLGTDQPGSGPIGLANRLHGYLNNDSILIPLPTVSALWDEGAVMRDYVLGDLILEILGVWTLVLVFSGLYLWWPRRSRSKPTNSERPTGVRIKKSGRARWRDLHGLSGVVLLSALLLTVVSGLAWSTYWGPNFTSLANELAPNSWTDAPTSGLGERGDLDRLGNTIHWNTGDIPIPASYATAADGTAPAAISLDSVATIADDEGMKPGYTISFPGNVIDETTGETVYGSFALSNSWPRTTGEARDLFLDQFTGETLADQSAYGYGAISYSVDTLVSTHMGTQLGLFSRLMMTVMCVLALWSVFSASVMFWKRRRPGTLGLPRRPVDVRLARGVTVIACVMAVIFPIWGITAATVLAFDRFVIRRQSRLRVAFGQR